MKKIFSIFGIAAMALSVVMCKPEEKPGPDVNKITEDGFYVVGEATGMSEVTADLSMAIGINEAAGQSTRDGMYEKYIVLQSGKEFTLAYVNGGKETAYGAELAEFKPEALEGIYQDNPADPVFKGKLVVGESAPKMKVSKTGLYHIVLDLNKASDLSDAQIVLSPATMGVRGGMNSWGFTPLEATAASNDGITYTLSGQELGNNGEFKFSYNGAWKITLDSEGAVKANTNLGKDSKPGGDNIVVADGAGKYKITLTFKLAAGDIANSFKYKTELESKADYPAELFMIGTDFGAWDWASDGVVALQHISAGGDPKDGCFVTTRFFKAESGFKFATAKEWGKDFNGMTTNPENITYDTDGNIHVPADGLWTFTIDYTTDKMTLTEGMIYGMGDCFGGDWTVGKNAGAVNADGTANITAQNDGVLRVYAPCAFDWWQHEFRPTEDGKIEYREGGELEGGFNVKAGDTIIFDFNAGTTKVISGGVPPTPGTNPTIKDFAQEYVKILDIWETNIADEIVLHPDDPDQKVKNAHYIPADTKIKVGDKEYNTADMLETALRSYLLTRGYDGLELTKYGKNSIDKILAPKAISETDIPETHDYLWGTAPYSETSGNGGYLVMGTKEVNEHCKVKVDILDNWAMRNMNYPMSNGKKISNISGYSGGQLDGYYGSFCPQRALITYAFFFKYMLDNNIDLGANVGNDVIIRSELFGDEGAAPEAEKIKAEWLFSKERMSDYADTFGGTTGKKDTNAGDGGCYVNSNVSPGGKITYVQIEKGSIDVDQKASRIVGSTGHPYVTGPWVGDYWLFTLSNGKELPAGTKAHIQYSTRVSKTGPKFWMAEYFDGEEWKPVVAPDKAEAAGPGVEYNLVMNPNGQEADNVAIDYTFTISKPVTEILYRQRVVSTIQANTGEALEKPNGGTSRIAYNAPDGTPYPPIFETL